MGSFARLKINGYPVFCMKSYVADVYMSFFEECDRRVFTRRRHEKSESICGTIEDESEETAFEYQIASSELKQRLDILGFTERAARQSFEQSVADSMRSMTEGNFAPGFWWMDEAEAEEFLRGYTFDTWIEQVTKFFASGGNQTYSREELERFSMAQRIIADHDSEEYIFGFPLCDPRLFIRGLLEVFPESVPVTLDYTDLVSSGYHKEDEMLAATAKLRASQEFVANSKIVVLTEGSTDARFLSGSLKILHPHLFPLFSFLDFNEPRLAGGAANLVHVLKGFAGAQIANRVIALFDNDTAGEEALRALDSVLLPDRFKILRYPDILLGKCYPTIGPQGEIKMDVNGLAGSVELYFGEDVLRGGNGDLARVQWKGYNQSLQKYQGELIGKRGLHERFARKIDAARDRHVHPDQDWSGMTAIWNSIFAACVEESKWPHRVES